MNKPNLFEIISPIMIGPSSSHTAGAIRLGLLARNIYNGNFTKVKFKLYNSYSHTGKGHGTDKALLAGILGLRVDDKRIKDIFNSNEAKSIQYSFVYEDDFRRHPNSVDISIEGRYKMNIQGDSIGAGNIKVTKINDFNVSISGDYNTIVIIYKDKPGMISAVTQLLQNEKLNIASLNCDRQGKGGKASMILCLDGSLTNSALEKIKQIEDIYFVTYIKKLEN